MRWLQGIQPGDIGLFSLAILAVLMAFQIFWQTDGMGEWAVVRQNGTLFAELDLHKKQLIHVSGPLGETQIEIGGGRARVASDPGPRQYCVKQGWLSRNGEIAICAPNQVSLQIRGRQKAYDSLAY
ncbi:MAG: hypothetical protein RIR18_1820 [Pseudomonadota bacterium]|jgi:hypothetical protein